MKMKAYGPRKWPMKPKVGVRMFKKKILSVNIALRAKKEADEIVSVRTSY